MNVVFTMPGKMGDALMQWPIVHQYIKQTGRRVDIWMDEKTCKPLVNLFKAQPGVDEVLLRGGIENYNCGGQPFHFDLDFFDLDLGDLGDRVIYHLGFRKFPERQGTLQSLQDSRTPITIPQDGWQPSLTVEAQQGPSTLVLHGQAVGTHNGAVPQFWKFLSGIRHEVDGLFDRVVWVGAKSDREVGKRLYPKWQDEFDDGGDVLETAKLIAGAKAFIGCGSSMVVLAANLGIPAIRVHDRIGQDAPRTIWSNLGENQLNETEIGLRTEWPIWRDKYLVESAVTKS